MRCDLIAFTISCLFMLIYYFYLSRRTRRTPDSSVQAVNAMIRERWVLMIMSNSKMDVLAIQTLRNSVMAASFMATTAMLLVIGVLNLGEKIGEWSNNVSPLIFICKTSNELWQIKLGILLLSFAIAFFHFAMAIRFFNHVGYMINLPCETSIEKSLYKQTCIYLNKAGRYYSMGTRTFFFGLPIILWFFGPCYLILGTLVLIMGLTLIDKAPKKPVG